MNKQKSDKGISTVVKDNFGIVVEEGTNVTIDILFDGIVGSIAPGIISAKQSFKQKKYEENIKTMLEMIMERSEQINKRIDIHNYDFINDKLFPTLCEFVIEEDEKEKIEYLFNGFESIIESGIQDKTIVLNYFDTLQELRFQDIKTLDYYAGMREDPFKGCAKDSAEFGLSKQIYSKLERLYLIKHAPTWGSTEAGGAVELPEEERKVYLTDYGEKFVHFVFKNFDPVKYKEKIQAYQIDEEEKLSRNITPRFG